MGKYASGRRQVDDASRTHSSSALLLELGVAADLYRADFLESIYDDWALLERERLRELYLNVLERLIVLHKQRGGYERALTYAQRLSAADPLREEAHRELMQLYHLLGRSQAALEQFIALRDLLVRELGAQPTPATTALYHEIVDALAEALASDRRSLRWAAVLALGDLGEKARPSVPALLAVAKGADGWNAIWARCSLVLIGGKAGGHLDAIRALDALIAQLQSHTIEPARRPALA